MADSRHDRGRAAEDAVATWLGRGGWRVLARRWRTRSGEVDLVCLDDAGWLVGVEVRLRSTRRTGSAGQSLDRRHVARVGRTLLEYAREAPQPKLGIRVDLVTVEPTAGGRWRLVRIAGVSD